MMRHRWQPQSTAAAGHGEREHPSDQVYVLIALILAIITGIEVWVYYIDALEDMLIPILIVLAAIKFVMVAGWFMHLRFDSSVFMWMFAGGLALSFAVFLVVLAAERILFV